MPFFKKTIPSGGRNCKGIISPEIVKKASGYGEVHRIREHVVGTILSKGYKTVLVTSPRDCVGNTFLVSVLGHNLAHFSSSQVLLVDVNMRRSHLNRAFNLPLEGGFTDIAYGRSDWRKLLNNTDLPNLKVLTAGKPDENLGEHLNRTFLENLLMELKDAFDVVMFDSSPILIHNRNNVDPALMSLFCDIILIAIQNKKTTRAELEKTVSAIPQNGGKFIGLVYNDRC